MCRGNVPVSGERQCFREYRKRVRVVDYRDPDYLNPAMKESLESYERCLAGLGFPHNLTGEQGGNRPALSGPTEPSVVAAELERQKSRACGVVGHYLLHCQPLLATCLSAPSQERVRARDAAWLVSRITENIGRAQFSFTDCEVVGLGGHIVSSASTLLALWSQALLTTTSLVLVFLLYV